MYQKVSPDMNFVDREKNVGKFWRNQQIFEKSMKAREGSRFIPFMMDRLPQTVSLISVMC